jgi:hypothetical protein
MGEVIVAAACKDVETGVVYVGARHFDEVMHKQLTAANVPTSATFVQGFITNGGRFVDRIEGMDIAIISGQVNPDEDPVLYSEHLY